MSHTRLQQRRRRFDSPSRNDASDGRRRILFVDDDPLAGAAFERSVRRAGYLVEVSRSPYEAIARAKERRFDVIVTDLRMPGMDGLTLLERFREIDRSCVSILVTGMPDVDLPRSPATDGSLLAVFGKPWDDVAMLESLDRAFTLCERRSALSKEHKLDLLRVLLVEDNPADAFLTKRALETHCTAVVEVAHRLRDAELLLDTCEFDVVVSDLSLPDGRGIDCIRRLRGAAGEAPIVVLTGLEDDEVAGQALESGAQEFLTKGELDGDKLGRVIAFARHRGRFVAQLTRLASYDALTGLANRRTLRDRLSHAQAVARPDGSHVALLAIDLDRFKNINDTLGHEAGDELLRVVAQRLQTVIREHDTAARLSGDEFAVLLGKLADPEDALTITQRLMTDVQRPVELVQGTVGVSLSVGISVSSTGHETLDEMLRSADEAMYQAKRGGRGRSVPPAQVAHARGLERLSLEMELREAVREQRFTLAYQPQYRLSDGELAGFEALLRWRRADGTPEPPSTFIPILEETGLITKVGKWVVEESCRELQRWRAAHPGHDARMSVNVAGQQFETPGLVELVRDALATSGLAPNDFELEITESVLMRDTAHATAALLGLRNLGVRIAIDDFGTGYSSLAYLKRFNVNTLKIDRSFVADIEQEASTCIASAIITLGQQLGMEVVAEGVETWSQAEYLGAAHGLVVQGYLFGRPGPQTTDFAARVTTPRLSRPSPVLTSWNASTQTAGE